MIFFAYWIYRRYILVFIGFLDCWKFIFGFIELQNERLFNCAYASSIFVVFQVFLLVIITDFIVWVDELMLTTIVFCFAQCFLESLFCVRVRLVMPWLCLLLDFSCRRTEYSSGRICHFHWRRVWCDSQFFDALCRLTNKILFGANWESALVFVHVDVSMNEENFLPRKICFDEETFQEKFLCNL